MKLYKYRACMLVCYKRKAVYNTKLQNGEKPHLHCLLLHSNFSINFPRLIKVIYTFSVKRQQFFPHPFQRQFYLLRHVFILKYTHMERVRNNLCLPSKKNLLILFLLSCNWRFCGGNRHHFKEGHHELLSAVCNLSKQVPLP